MAGLVIHNAKITRVPQKFLLPNNALITIEFNMFRHCALENIHFGVNWLEKANLCDWSVPNLSRLSFRRNQLTKLPSCIRLVITSEIDLSYIPVHWLRVVLQSNAIERFDLNNTSPNVTTLEMAYNSIDCSFSTPLERAMQKQADCQLGMNITMQ